VSVELLRHVNALVADLAAEHGEVDLVGRRLDCEPTARDAIVEGFEAFGVVGAAGLRVRRDDGVLLVRYEGTEGWVDPGDARRPGESYRESARRAVREATGVEAAVEGLAQVHLLYMDDWTDRPPVPNPYLVFEGRPTGGRLEAGPGVAETRWAAAVPEAVVYEELAELSLPE
jgi:ADP-ribose pyrophosphatase YjhB (NUDIX family)